MSKSERETGKKSENNLEIIEQITKKYFSEIENSVPHFQQTVFDLQNEYYKAWKNMVNTNISLQKKFTEEAGINFIIPEIVKMIIKETNEGFADTRSMYNKINITTIESTKKNIKMWNDDADTFVKFNKNITQYWASFFTAK